MSSEPQPSSTSAGEDTASAEPMPEMHQDHTPLDDVIQETVTSEEERGRDARAVREVAQELRGQHVSLESVTPELVRAVLSWRFGHLDNGGPLWHSVAEAIGYHLLDDDYSRARLQSLWQKLDESAT